MTNAIDTVLFDLDGTLLDTARDMAAALNVVLTRHGRAPLPPATVRPFVSKGGMALVCLGFNITDADDNATALRDEFLQVYRDALAVHTKLFDGMENLLRRLDADGRAVGVVTNKNAFLTEPLLNALQLTARLKCIVSGDTLAKRKPEPEPLLHACELAGTTPARAVYVGDDARDVEAGKRAGMRTLAAAYGYIVPGDDAHAWGADAVVDHPGEVKVWLDAHG